MYMINTAYAECTEWQMHISLALIISKKNKERKLEGKLVFVAIMNDLATAVAMLKPIGDCQRQLMDCVGNSS